MPRLRMYARIGSIELWECAVPGCRSIAVGTSPQHAFAGWDHMGRPQ